MTHHCEICETKVILLFNSDINYGIHYFKTIVGLLYYRHIYQVEENFLTNVRQPKFMKENAVKITHFSICVLTGFTYYYNSQWHRSQQCPLDQLLPCCGRNIELHQKTSFYSRSQTCHDRQQRQTGVQQLV